MIDKELKSRIQQKKLMNNYKGRQNGWKRS
jgi:hypothetical protein